MLHVKFGHHEDAWVDFQTHRVEVHRAHLPNETSLAPLPWFCGDAVELLNQRLHGGELLSAHKISELPESPKGGSANGAE
jgi:hypothetical protein